MPDPSMEWRPYQPNADGWYWLRGVRIAGERYDGSKELIIVEGEPDGEYGPFPVYAHVSNENDLPAIVFNNDDWAHLYHVPKSAEWWGPFHAPR